MKILDTFDATNLEAERIVYVVDLDDGRTVDVLRTEVPHTDQSNWSLMEPFDDAIDAEAIIAFLKENAVPTMNRVFTIERKRRASKVVLVDECYSLQEVMYLMNRSWCETECPEQWEVIRASFEGKVIVDFTNSFKN